MRRRSERRGDELRVILLALLAVAAIGCGSKAEEPAIRAGTDEPLPGSDYRAAEASARARAQAEARSQAPPQGPQ